MRGRIYIATVGENAVSLAKEYAAGIELDHICQAEKMDGTNRLITMDSMKTAIRASENRGTILHAPFNELHPAAIDPKARALAMERYRDTIHIAEELGIKNLVVHSGYLPFVYFKSYHLEKSIEFWHELAKDMPKDIKINIENVLEDEPEMMAELIDGIADERFGICLDVGHAACMSKLPAAEWVRTLGARITHSHLHCNDGKMDTHDIFDCENAAFDMREVLDLLAERGAKDMTYTVEALNPKPCMEWLKKNNYI